MDCELVVALQGFQETYDSDGEPDEDIVQIGTESAAVSVADAIALLGEEEILQRKGLTPQAIKLWVPRNAHLSGYKKKKTVAAKLKVHQLDGYKQKQVFCYITADGLEPVLELQEEAREEHQEEETQDYDETKDYQTPAGSPRKSSTAAKPAVEETQPPSPTRSSQSKRTREGDAKEEQTEDMDTGEDPGEDQDDQPTMALDLDPTDYLAEQAKKTRITVEGKKAAGAKGKK